MVSNVSKKCSRKEYSCEKSLAHHSHGAMQFVFNSSNTQTTSLYMAARYGKCGVNVERSENKMQKIVFQAVRGENMTPPLSKDK